MYKILCGCLCLFLLGTSLGSKSPGHMLILHLLFELPPDFSIVAAPFLVPTSNVCRFRCPFFLANAGICPTFFSRWTLEGGSLGKSKAWLLGFVLGDVTLREA